MKEKVSSRETDSPKDRDRVRTKENEPSSSSNLRRQTSSGGYGAGSQSNTSASQNNGSSSQNGGSYSQSSDSVSRFGNQRAISSADFFGEDQPPQSRNDDTDVLKTLGEGFSRFSLAALEVSKNAAEKMKQSTSDLTRTVQEKGWSVEVSAVGSKISETSGKGWTLVQDYWSKAKDSAAEFAAQLNQPPSQLGTKNQNTQLFQQDGNSPNGVSSSPTVRENDKTRGREDELTRKKNQEFYSLPVKEEEPPADLEDWLNDENNSRENEIEKGWNGSDWDDIATKKKKREEPKPSPSIQKKKEESKASPNIQKNKEQPSKKSVIKNEEDDFYSDDEEESSKKSTGWDDWDDAIEEKKVKKGTTASKKGDGDSWDKWDEE